MIWCGPSVVTPGQSALLLATLVATIPFISQTVRIEMTWEQFASVTAVVSTLFIGVWNMANTRRGQRAEQKADAATNIVDGFDALLRGMQNELRRVSEGLERCEARERQLRKDLADTRGSS